MTDGPGPADDQPQLDIPGIDGVERIGTGSSATVYRARQALFDRTVAVRHECGLSRCRTPLNSIRRQLPREPCWPRQLRRRSNPPGSGGLKGTATTFYSENPGKPLGHHWDADPANLGDFDLNVTSSTMVDGFSTSAIEPHEVYGVFRTSDMMEAFPELRAFAERWQVQLGREVNFVGYPAPTGRDATEYVLVGGQP